MATSCCYTDKIMLTFLIFSLISSSSVSSTQEVDILLSFKDSIDDPQSSLSTWSKTSATHHCNWAGVLCSSTYPLLVTSLNLQRFNLSGEISPSLCELSSLAQLNLADNQFNQPIPLHLSQCASLETLNLSNNLIWGTIPEGISQFGSLSVLDVSRNHLEGKIPETIGSLKKLQVLNLGSNLLSGTVPVIFGNLSELLVLDLSQNPFLASEIPPDIGKLTKLEQLLLQSSGFYGQIPSFFNGLTSLTIVDLSLNNLTGDLPLVDVSLEKLISFDVSQNKLSGSFPVGICKKSLINLSLHTNLFNGSIPNDSINECSKLERFQVQNNVFSGEFPSLLWSLPKLKLIRAENNRFSGEIPDLISHAPGLEQVQIDNNSFSSRIPEGVGMIRSLYRFSASQNGLYGEIPSNFCDSPVMSIINLSHNHLSGGIPALNKCRKLVSLSLADNSFEGEIPRSLAELPVLTYLDLSRNNLTGSIPQDLQNLKLALFDVSFNRLSGRVPLTLISGLPASYLEGNPELCGPGLPNDCLDGKPMRRRDGFSKLTCALISLTIVVLILIIAAGFYVVRRGYKRRSEMSTWRSVFFYPLRLTEIDLIMAMNEKSALGNSATFGRVYSVRLPSGELVAVKKFENFGSQSPKALEAEIKSLAKIRHKKITKILGFCHSNESVFLIYEYLAKRSLGDMISQPDFHLSWSLRLRIAIGVAQGLAYLHKDYVPHLLHRNIKSRNILLDADFEPKLTDFALDRIVGDAAFESTVASESSASPYLPPEYSYTKKATEQMDTYSFGVVLLELVTGRQAEESKSEGSLDVVKWVRRKINIADGAEQVLDPKISSISQQDMSSALEIALRCTAVVPEKRPSMPEVVRALQSLDSKSILLEPSSSEDRSVPL